MSDRRPAMSGAMSRVPSGENAAGPQKLLSLSSGCSWQISPTGPRTVAPIAVGCAGERVGASDDDARRHQSDDPRRRPATRSASRTPTTRVLARSRRRRCAPSWPSRAVYSEPLDASGRATSSTPPPSATDRRVEIAARSRAVGPDEVDRPGPRSRCRAETKAIRSPSGDQAGDQMPSGRVDRRSAELGDGRAVGRRDDQVLARAVEGRRRRAVCSSGDQLSGLPIAIAVGIGTVEPIGDPSLRSDDPMRSVGVAGRRSPSACRQARSTRSCAVAGSVAMTVGSVAVGGVARELSCRRPRGCGRSSPGRDGVRRRRERAGRRRPRRRREDQGERRRSEPGAGRGAAMRPGEVVVSHGEPPFGARPPRPLSGRGRPHAGPRRGGRAPGARPPRRATSETVWSNAVVARSCRTTLHDVRPGPRIGVERRSHRPGAPGAGAISPSRAGSRASSRRPAAAGRGSDAGR